MKTLVAAWLYRNGSVIKGGETLLVSVVFCTDKSIRPGLLFQLCENILPYLRCILLGAAFLHIPNMTIY
jgi:hypothetical protein